MGKQEPKTDIVKRLSRQRNACMPALTAPQAMLDGAPCCQCRLLSAHVTGAQIGSEGIASVIGKLPYGNSAEQALSAYLPVFAGDAALKPNHNAFTHHLDANQEASQDAEYSAAFAWSDCTGIRKQAGPG